MDFVSFRFVPSVRSESFKVNRGQDRGDVDCEGDKGRGFRYEEDSWLIEIKSLESEHNG